MDKVLEQVKLYFTEKYNLHVSSNPILFASMGKALDQGYSNPGNIWIIRDLLEELVKTYGSPGDVVLLNTFKESMTSWIRTLQPIPDKVADKLPGTAVLELVHLLSDTWKDKFIASIATGSNSVGKHSLSIHDCNKPLNAVPKGYGVDYRITSSPTSYHFSQLMEPETQFSIINLETITKYKTIYVTRGKSKYSSVAGDAVVTYDGKEYYSLINEPKMNYKCLDVISMGLEEEIMKHVGHPLISRESVNSNELIRAENEFAYMRSQIKKDIANGSDPIMAIADGFNVVIDPYEKDMKLTKISEFIKLKRVLQDSSKIDEVLEQNINPKSGPVANVQVKLSILEKIVGMNLYVV